MPEGRGLRHIHEMGLCYGAGFWYAYCICGWVGEKNLTVDTAVEVWFSHVK